MNNRQLQPFVSSSAAIRQEIQRFESVHPSIYAIYDIIELIPDPLLAQQIREHVVCIEGKLTMILNNFYNFMSCLILCLKLGQIIQC